MNAFPNGTRVFFWTSAGEIKYGTVQSTSRPADGTQVVIVALDGGEGRRSLPVSSVNTPANGTQRPSELAIPLITVFDMNPFPVGYQRAPRSMLVVISKLLKAGARYLSQSTLYEMVCSSHDFEDVKVALSERTNWSIELFRSCFNIRLANGGYVCILSLLFLVVAENMHMHYGRLPPTKLKERAEEMGHVAFTILFAALDLGVVIVRVAGIFALSETPALATGLVFISMVPSIIPLLIYPITILKSRRGRTPGGGAEIEPSDV